MKNNHDIQHNKHSSENSMITIQLTILLILIGMLHMERDRLDYTYKTTVWYRLPDWLQAWFNPVISQHNKKSDNAIWELVKTVILVDFTDFKHFLMLLQIVCWFSIISLYIQVEWHEYIMMYVIRGIGVFISNLNWFGNEK